MENIESSTDLKSDNAFNVFIRVKPNVNSDQNNIENEPTSIVKVSDNQIFVRDPSPLGDYLVF